MCFNGIAPRFLEILRRFKRRWETRPPCRRRRCHSHCRQRSGGVWCMGLMQYPSIIYMWFVSSYFCPLRSIWYMRNMYIEYAYSRYQFVLSVESDIGHYAKRRHQICVAWSCLRCRAYRVMSFSFMCNDLRFTTEHFFENAAK